MTAPIDINILAPFIGRRDAYAVQQPNGAYTAIRSHVDSTLLEAHISGKVTVGTYTLISGELDLAGYGCADLDGDPTDLKATRNRALRVWEIAVALVGAKSLILEFSGNKGYHIWLIVEPMPASKVRRILRHIARNAGEPDIEVFPKQVALGENGLGSLVKLPLALHRKSGKRSMFLDPVSLEPIDPTDIDPVRLTEADVDRILATLPPEPAEDQRRASPVEGEIPEGRRVDTLVSLAGSMRRRGMTASEILAALRAINEGRCKPPLDDRKLEDISGQVSEYQPSDPAGGGPSPPPPKPEARWPAPLGEAAFYGLVGDIVRVIEPETEADPAALLVQFLTAFGSYVGRGPYFRVEGDHHYSNLFMVLVGATSKARKGTSMGRICDLFRRAARIGPPGNFTLADAWVQDRIQSGLSSGEGLIGAVRDPTYKMAKEEPVVTDPGEIDKRLLVLEPEYARVLKAAQREGNTLSAIIRTAWDIGNLRSMTKTPVVATGAHVSIVGHVTAEELRRSLDETDIANGLVNRFVFVACKRSKELPEGGHDLEEDTLDTLAGKIQEAADAARKIGAMYRDEEARALWREVYHDLSEGVPGLLGAVTGRAEAQVLRLSLVYALTDGSPAIKVPHLTAALEVWRYAFDSARYVFGEALGDVTADLILQSLQANPDGLDRTAIRDLFGRNKSASEIQRGLDMLLRLMRVEMTRVETDGRPREVWKAT